MLKFHIIIIKFSIFTKKNSQSDTFFSKLKNTIVKIDMKSFSVYDVFCRKDKLPFIIIILEYFFKLLYT